MRPQVGQVINNKYRLLRLIGDGGMGSVYEARHEVLGTSVALKFLHHELSRRAGLVQRFLQEARVSAQIQSPHVVRVTDVDQTSSGAFIVMEYLDGRTLQTLYEELYRAGQQLSYADALEYAMQMLEGVEAAHKQGVVHRDLKPDNVMITSDARGRPLLKLLDFGIAKLRASSEYDRGLTRPGVIMGTPEYMAPEQAFSADAVDARADIFSLGVMIFEMLAGRRPVGGDEPQQIAAAYLSGRIAGLTELAPSMAPELGLAVHRAMAPHARDRWQSVTDLRDALEPFAVAAKAPSVMPRVSLMSSPGLTPSVATPAAAAITPAATNVGGDSAAAKGPIPGTLLPAEGHAVGPDATNPADPPVMSHPKLRGPTPLGGFVLAEVEQAVANASGDHGGSGLPPTKEVSPYVPEPAPGADHASTAYAAPLPAYEPHLDHSPRPSGTAIGAPIFVGGGEAAIDPVFGGPARGPSAVAPAPVPVARKKQKGGLLSSLPAILLLAAGVAGAVVGGVYIAQSRAGTDEHDDPPITSAPSASVQSDPPVEPPVEPPPPPPPTFKPLAPPPPPPRKPITPPRGSGSPNQPPPPPSSQPSSRPPFPFPPIVIPSTFPFSFPFPDMPPPRTRPDLPPPQREDPPRRQRDPYQQGPDRYQHDPFGAESPRRRRSRPGAMPHGPQSGADDMGLRD